MLTANGLKRIVNDWRGYISIPDRATVTRITMFVKDLLKESGYEDAAYFTNALANELDSMDTDEIVKACIWKG